MAEGQQMREVGLKDYVNSGVVTPDHFYLKQTQRPDVAPAGGVLLKVLAISSDPYLRGRMRNAKSYFPPFVPGQPIVSGAVARVLATNSSDYGVGDVVTGLLPWQEYLALPAESLGQLTKVDNPHDFPVTYYLSILGMPSLTAYGSVKRIAQPKAGETAFISGAAGAVGLVAGQLLKKVYGCRVVGSAGSDEKVAFLTNEIGFDAAFNYKTTSVAEGLAKHCPEGLNIYFDNVGGETLEAALDACQEHARVVACGVISQYDITPDERPPLRNKDVIATKHIKLKGLIVTEYYADPDMVKAFHEEVSALVTSQQVKVVEHVTKGIENAGAAFCEMMGGGNLGKAVVLFE